MKIRFTKRNEEGLHCRFCYAKIHGFIPLKVNLYKTSPVKGIVCEHCKEHLKSYID